jgi:alpha-beta hydrolase superfamily lysophospholipase
MAEVAKVTGVVVDELDKVKIPLLALHGTANKMAASQGSVDLVERAASTDKTLHLVAGGWHALLRDVDRVAVEDLIIAWIDARIPAA